MILKDFKLMEIESHCAFLFAGNLFQNLVSVYVSYACTHIRVGVSMHVPQLSDGGQRSVSGVSSCHPPCLRQSLGCSLMPTPGFLTHKLLEGL